jgi:hypothetical protein
MTNQEIEKQVKLVRESFPGDAGVLKLCAMVNLLLSQRKSGDQLAREAEEHRRKKEEAEKVKSGKKSSSGNPAPAA